MHSITYAHKKHPTTDTPKSFALKSPQMPFVVHNVYMIDYFLFFFVEIIQMCINLLLYGASRGWHLTFVDASVLLLGVLDLVVIGIGD